MTMLDDVLGAAVPGAKNRICTLWRRRKGKPGSDPSSSGIFVGRCLIAVLVCAGAALIMSGAANAKASKGSAKASAAPALDAQAIDAAQLPAASGKGRARSQRGRAHQGRDIARSRRLLTWPDRRQDRDKLSKGCRRVSGRKRNQAERQPRPANLGAPDRDLQRPDAGRVRDSAGGREGPFQQDHSVGLGKKAELKTLNFTSPRELLAEKFHIDP